MRIRHYIATAAVAALTLAAVTPRADAGQRSGYVTAYSNYGNGSVRGPVRMARFGQQVRLPGGTWIYCENKSLLFDRHRPCSETLRRQSLDFWETIDEQAPR